MRLMYDAVTPANIPRDAAMVAGYINGPYRWKDSDWDMFPNAVKVRISVRATGFIGAHVLDVEPGDATPQQAYDWVYAARLNGLDYPTIYCNLSTWPTVRNEFLRRGMAEPLYWIAHYNGQFDIPPGAIAKQYLPNFQGTDHSAVADFWPGVDAKTAPVANGDVTMIERITVTPPNDGQNSVRVYLSGTAAAGVVIRPSGLDADGYQRTNPVFVGNIFAWGSDHVGIGHNPTQVPGYNNRVESVRRYELPGAVWADIEYSSHRPFYVDTY